MRKLINGQDQGLRNKIKSKLRLEREVQRTNVQQNKKIEKLLLKGAFELYRMTYVMILSSWPDSIARRTSSATRLPVLIGLRQRVLPYG